jgi:hypothetical protein
VCSGGAAGYGSDPEVRDVRAGGVRCQERTNLCGFGRDGQAKGPAERTTTLRDVEAPHTGVQPRSPAGEEVPLVGNEYPFNDDDAEQ